MNEREIFLSALEFDDSAARQAHLQSTCAGNPSLLARVESLLATHESESVFLQTPVVEQISDGSSGDGAATILFGSSSTTAEESDVPESESNESLLMTERLNDDQDNEIPVGYLLPSDKPDSIGRLGHYEIREVIGRGAFGTVLKAFDEKLQRVVAIKVLAPELAATSPARKRFLREARSAAAVRHEHVVNIYAVEEQPTPYLVMEYIPGKTLQQRLDEKGPLDVSDVLRLGRQIAEGLAAAAGQGLIHRDIKPGNILLEEGVQERVKITDFGLARAADDASMTQSGLIAGTPMYMAPEQALGRTLDPRADLFSLGSVLYQMVSGRAPFRASSTLAVLKRVTEDTPRLIKEIIPETPQWLCDIITKLHAKNPDKRFQSAREVADVLADCEVQLKANAKLQDFSRIPRVASQSRSGRWKWVAAAVVLLPILILSGTEIVGVTHLFRGRKPEGETIAHGGEMMPNPVANVNPPDAEGWLQLFNGKDLVGWKTHPDQPGNWRVENGILVGSLLNGQVNHLFTERDDFQDFHLRAEVQISPIANSGIYFRSPLELRFLNGTFPPAYEVAIYNNDGPDSNDTYKTGSIHAVNLYPDVIVKNLDWFTLDVDVRGRHVKVQVNGTTTVDAELEPDPYRKEPRGHIVLQVVFGTVRFRKIEIKELPAVDTLARFHFGEDERTVLKESSGNNHHGEIIGAKWVKADGSPISSPPEPESPPLAIALFDAEHANAQQ